MQNVRAWLGALLVSVPFAFAACGDDEDDDGGGDGSTTGGRGGSTGGSVTGGRSGAGMGGTTTGGRGGTAGRGGQGGTTTGGAAGAGEGGSAGDDGGMGGDDGGMGGEAGEPQGGSAGAGMGGTGGAGMGGSAGAVAGGGVGGAGSGGLAGGGMAGAGGVAPTCDPTPAPEIYVGVLSGAQEVPPVTTTATGFVVAQLNAAATELTSSVYWNGLSANISNGHIHGPAAVGATALPVFHYFGDPAMPPPNSQTGSAIGVTFPITTAQQLADLRAGLYYANIHSVGPLSGGEIRAQLVPAAAIRSGNLVGAQEVPPVTTTATGRAVVAVFPGNAYASVSVSWTGLTTNTSAAHIHGPATFGMVANPPIFDLQPPLGAMSGSVVHKVWTLTGSQPTELLGSLHYANVHSTLNGSGEIRAQLLPPCP